MSIKGFVVNGSTVQYDYNYLDNKPSIPSGGGSSVPSVASTVAQMSNTSLIYIYGGSEPGYTAGNWYFYNSGVQEWVSGGVYCGITSADLQQALSTFLANNSAVLTNADTTSY